MTLSQPLLDRLAAAAVRDGDLATARDAARQRLIEAARGNPGPGWRTQRTALLPQVNRPLMTPGAEHRTRRNRR